MLMKLFYCRMLPKDIKIQLLLKEIERLQHELSKAKTFIYGVHQTFAGSSGKYHVIQCSSKMCESFVGFCRNSEIFKWTCNFYRVCGVCNRMFCDSHMGTFCEKTGQIII